MPRTLTWKPVEPGATQAVIESERGWEATTSTELAPKIVKACNNHDKLLQQRDDYLLALKQIAEANISNAMSRYGMKELARTIVSAAAIKEAE